MKLWSKNVFMVPNDKNTSSGNKSSMTKVAIATLWLMVSGWNVVADTTKGNISDLILQCDINNNQKIDTRSDMKKWKTTKHIIIAENDCKRKYNMSKLDDRWKQLDDRWKQLDEDIQKLKTINSILAQ